MTVCVIGLGYIGLPTAVFIASRGRRVVGVDIKSDHVHQINQGKVPFYEPGFDNALKKVVNQGFLTARTDTPKAEIYIIAVPTPFGNDRHVDNSFIKAAARDLAPQLKGGELVILESTSPPGTTKWLADFILRQRPDLSLDDSRPNCVYVAHAPERVLPGRIMEEMVQNDRVIGGVTPRAAQLARDLYASFSHGQIHTTDTQTAEMVKLAENTFRDINIAYANELSIICDKLQIDVWELIRLANQHPRVNILQPGPGVGGHCIAVDPWFIVAAAPKESKLIRSAREVNDAKPDHIVQKALKIVSGHRDPLIACLGITFKPNVSDLRGSPAIEVVKALSEKLPNARLKILDPLITRLPAELTCPRNVELQDLRFDLSRADLIIGLVKHSAFKPLLPAPVGVAFLDTAGFFDLYKTHTFDTAS